MKSLFLRLYLLVGILHLFFIARENTQMEMISKYFLMPLLMMHVFVNTKHGRSFYLYVFIALLFCWAGDVLLLYTMQNANFFMAGLAAFLLGHIFYIIYFGKSRWKGNSLLSRKRWLFILPVIYSGVFIGILYQHLGDMRIPVLAYTIVITLMLMSAMNRSGLTDQYSFIFIFAGAILFVISDSLIAVNKFYSPFRAASILIMFTYIAAQYLIVSGALLHGRSRQSE